MLIIKCSIQAYVVGVFYLKRKIHRFRIYVNVLEPLTSSIVKTLSGMKSKG